MESNHRSNSKERNWSRDLERKASRLAGQTQEFVRYSNERQVIIRRGNQLQLVAFPLFVGIAVVAVMLFFLPRFLAVVAIGALVAGIRVDIARSRYESSRDVEDVDYRRKND